MSGVVEFLKCTANEREMSNMGKSENVKIRKWEN